jgi:pimeloyl-ACP methyl ester carboxylesterase
MSTQILRTDPLGLRVARDGHGPDVLLVGGLTDDLTIWDAQVAGLADRFRLTRYDGRATPAAPTPPGPYALADLVADALAVIDVAGIERAHVVGSALGGVIAQKLAIFHPERVASITLSATWARPDRALRARYASWRWAAERARSIGPVLGTVFSCTYGAAAWNSGLVDRRIAAAETLELSGDAGSWARTRDAFIWTSSAALEHDTRDALTAVHAPALVVMGEHDPVVGRHHGRQLAALLRDSRVEVVAGAGHRPHEEQPEAFTAAFAAFLAAQRSRAVAA